MTTAIIVLVVLLVALAALGYVLVTRRRREREELQERFGPEYDRAVDESGSRRAAEHRLADAAARRDRAEVRDLTAQEQEEFSQRWTQAQADFVDDPAGAAGRADDLVGEVMRERGYPLDHVEDRGDLMAAEHAALAGHYRAAHAIGQRAHEASTEELRQAFVHYRALFTELLGASEGRHTLGNDGSEDLTGVGRVDGEGARRRGQLAGQQELDLTAGERTQATADRKAPPV